MNIHKRCEKNVANNCGINTRDMAQVMQEMGISGDKIFPRKKVSPLLHATAVMTETYTFFNITIIFKDVEILITKFGGLKTVLFL